MGFFDERERRQDLKKMLSQKIDYDSKPFLAKIKPREKYIFKSDYFIIDDTYATILSFFHMDGAADGYPAFWGVGRIPSGLDFEISTIGFEQIRRMPKNWVDSKASVAESVAAKNETEQDREGTSSTKQKASRRTRDLDEIASDLNNNAAYLQCFFRVMVKAPTLEKLDRAVDFISRRYLDIFSTLSAAPYMGCQKQELSTLFSQNRLKMGKKYYFTSTEFAGDYNLVTHGLEDQHGEYVGKMYGDVNNSAVLFDVDNYKHHVVIANEYINEKHGRIYMTDYWGSKISQSCMFHNGRVIHMILDNCDLNKLGPRFDGLTYRLDMNQGDINMFEMFGKTDDELMIFPMQMQKLILMAEQAYETTDQDRSIIRGSLEEIATKFYVDNKMWFDDAQSHRSRIRITNIPHEQVPKLQMFVAYLNTAHKAALAAVTRDEEKVHALAVLKTTFNALLTSNGDLFNTTTTSVIDGAKTGRRVIYDFSKLHVRGKGVAMAQFVNVLAFAITNIGAHDTIIFHGTEFIDDRIKDYVNDQLDLLYARGGRAVFLYNKTDKMLEDKKLSSFDKADYTVMGTMTPNQIDKYQEELGRAIPTDLVNLISIKNPKLAYIRRGFTNVVFEQDLLLGIKRSNQSEVRE